MEGEKKKTSEIRRDERKKESQQGEREAENKTDRKIWKRKKGGKNEGGLEK